MKDLEFPDHYEYTKNELVNMTEESSKNNYLLTTTEKDYYRLKRHNLVNLKYLKCLRFS